MHYAQEYEQPSMHSRMGRKAKATSDCLINIVRIRLRCLCRPRYLGRSRYAITLWGEFYEGCGLMMHRPIGLSAIILIDRWRRSTFSSACDLSKVANCNFSTSLLPVLGLLVVTDRCIV